MELEDKVMAMEFAFMSLARALHDQGTLPLPVLAAHVQCGSDQLRETVELAPVAEQLDSLRDALVRLQ
ncbi:MAG: hypothetical protein WAV95_16020 [Azonexus sp.]